MAYKTHKANQDVTEISKCWRAFSPSSCTQYVLEYGCDILEPSKIHTITRLAKVLNVWDKNFLSESFYGHGQFHLVLNCCYYFSTTRSSLHRNGNILEFSITHYLLNDTCFYFLWITCVLFQNSSCLKVPKFSHFMGFLRIRLCPLSNVVDRISIFLSFRSRFWFPYPNKLIKFSSSIQLCTRAEPSMNWTSDWNSVLSQWIKRFRMFFRHTCDMLLSLCYKRNKRNESNLYSLLRVRSPKALVFKHFCERLWPVCPLAVASVPSTHAIYFLDSPLSNVGSSTCTHKHSR